MQTMVDAGRVVPPLDARRRFLRMTERNVVGHARTWPILLAGVFEPFLYLLSIGIGVGALVGDVTYSGSQIPFETFVASGMLATAAMNGAVFDTTFNFFLRLKYAKLYDAVLSTPLEPRDVALGEVTWALLRSTFYSAAFLVTMWAFGLTDSWWTFAALPTTVLIGAAFASVGLAASTYMRSFLDFDFINITITPMFLFSATFFPLEQYPGALEVLVQLTPLYQGVALCRAFTTGEVDPTLLIHVAYLLVMLTIGVRVAGRRIDTILRS
ncbi:MAG: ABC transporter permease [Acidimicrobiales bacterium]|nr:ABC transporter permease [Acidimicrobiales bacterium]